MHNIPYGRQQIEPEDIESVIKVLRSDFLTQGPAVLEFENSVIQFIKKISNDPTDINALAVNNGTTALHLACLALGVKRGDKILVTSNSFAATSNCVLYCGGDVEFVDINSDDLCIDIDQVKKIIESAPPGTYKGVIAVDFAGYPLDMKKLREITNQYNMWIIEDACHAIGATRTETGGSKYAAGGGKYADISVFSFHPVKHIATGEGGMILTRSTALNEKLKLLRTHGITKDPAQLTKVDGGWYYEMQTLGYNGRISDILCALGISQMKRIESNLISRKKIALRYQKELADLPIKLPIVDAAADHAYHLYVIQTEHRKELYDFLISRKIYVQVHYVPIYKFPYYVEKYGSMIRNNCDQYYKKCLSIPMYHSLTDEDQTEVIKQIKEFFKNKA